MSKSQDLLTTQEFAQKAGLTPSTVSKWLRSGKLNGEKIGGKWMIPADQATKIDAPTPAQPASSKAAMPAPKTSAKATQEKTSMRAYSIDEFSSMTFLTPYGVQLWLKSGRLKGQKDASGNWGVDASNLESPDVQRLLRK